MTAIRVGMMTAEYKVGDHVIIGNGKVHWIVRDVLHIHLVNDPLLILESPMSNRHRRTWSSDVHPWRP